MGSSRAKKPPPLNNNNKNKSLKPSSNSIKKKKKTKTKTKTKTKSKKPKSTTTTTTNNNKQQQEVTVPVQKQEPFTFFLDQFQSANKITLSSLELDSIKEKAVVEPCEQDFGLDNYLKKSFGDKWKCQLCDGKRDEVSASSPAVLIVSASALRALELLKAVRSLTTAQCPAVKLFSKHMKIEEQVALLKNRVNIACGTPSRINKLIDIEALGLSRLQVLVLDLHADVKGYSLFTLPQVRDEFWDLYKNCFHQRLTQGDLRICLYGPIPNSNALKGKKKNVKSQ